MSCRRNAQSTNTASRKLTAQPTVTAGHQIDHRDGWDNRLIEWLNEFLPPAEDYRAYQREYQAEIANNTQKWRMAQSSGDKWQGYNAGVPGELDHSKPNHAALRMVLFLHSNRIRLLFLLSFSTCTHSGPQLDHRRTGCQRRVSA